MAAKGEKEDKITFCDSVMSENGMRKRGPPSSGCCKMLDTLSLSCLGNCPVSVICINRNTLQVGVEKVVLNHSPDNCHVPNCTCSSFLIPMVLWGLPRLAWTIIIPCVWVEKGVWAGQDLSAEHVQLRRQEGMRTSWGTERWGQERFNQRISFDQIPNFCRQTKVM